MIQLFHQVQVLMNIKIKQLLTKHPPTRLELAKELQSLMKEKPRNSQDQECIVQSKNLKEVSQFKVNKIEMILLSLQVQVHMSTSKLQQQ